jgi:hypothetical protein
MIGRMMHELPGNAEGGRHGSRGASGAPARRLTVGQVNGLCHRGNRWKWPQLAGGAGDWGSLKRSFLFLQGVCSPFFASLADRLVADGYRVYKINFNAGDLLYWGARPAWNYRGDLSGLRDFLDEKWRRHGVTDQILFGDRRPIHRPAIDHASSVGIRSHVFEEGYLRPCWVTLEREGVNGHSLLPRDPDWFRRVGERLPDYGNGEPFASPFRIRAAHDVAYHVAGIANPILFNRYRTHAPGQCGSRVRRVYPPLHDAALAQAAGRCPDRCPGRTACAFLPAAAAIEQRCPDSRPLPIRGHERRHAVRDGVICAACAGGGASGDQEPSPWTRV